uniref:Peptidase M14 domain-containing protein n=1 Tax=Glossina brevipalpis TaxID=37001 RepID=A0A1A9WWA5_9MUSC
MANIKKVLRRIKDCMPSAYTSPRDENLFIIKNLVPKDVDWTFYPTLVEIYTWLDLIIQQHPKIVTGFQIGRSYEGRLIRGIKISFKRGKKSIFVESNIHPREWITSVTATYIIKELLSSKNPDVRKMAESLDWYIIPVLNVDGFVYSHEKDRMWKKSRRPVNAKCVGIDLNRNFNFQWGGETFDPSSMQYAGPHPESEPEVKQLIDFIDNGIPRGNIAIYVALHAPAQCILCPWTHTKVPPKNYKEMIFVAKAFASALRMRYGTKYKCGSSAKILRQFTGGSKDWAYAVKGIPITFTIELPGKGTKSRFKLPSKKILPVGKELLDGFVGMIEAVKKLGYI